MAESQPHASVAEAPRSSRTRYWILAAILAAYVAWGIAYLRASPWGGGLDEPLHANYVKVLAEERRLPWLYQEGGEWVRYREAHAMHPPVYHLMQVPIYSVTSGSEQAARVAMRAFSLVLGALSVVLVWALAMHAFKGRLPEVAAVTAFYAFMPHVLLISSVVNNDIASVLAFLLLLYLAAVRWSDRMTWARAGLLGLVAGIAGLTKGTCEVAGFPMAAMLVYLADRETGRGRAALKAGLTLAIAIAIVTPWHLRNLSLYGSLSYMPDDGPNPLLPGHESLLVQMLHDNFLPVVGHALKWQVNTLWAQEDWIPPDLRPWVYGAGWVFLVGGGLGGAYAYRRHRERFEPRVWIGYLSSTVPLWLMALYIALFAHFGWTRGGRYLLCLLPGLASLPVASLILVPRTRPWAAWVLPVVVAGALLALNLTCMSHLTGELIPRHGQAPLIP
jgi:4-amino-4-deoxy-L-arabinose transferase-like glycosyltransferase